MNKEEIEEMEHILICLKEHIALSDDEDNLLLDYITNLQQENKKYKEVIDKIMNMIKQYGKYDGKKCTRGFQMWSADFNKILDMLKEVSE